VKNLVFLLVALGLGGCANKSLVRFEKVSKAATSQDFRRAIAEIRKDPGLYGSHSQLLYHMDLGILYHYAGFYDSSLVELEKAKRIEDELFTRSISNEAASFLTNDNIRPYRGKPYEVVLMGVFQAFNYLALGKTDDALVEARQLQIYVDERKRKAGDDAESYADDGLYRTLAALAYESAGQRDDALISLYQAVKAYRTHGKDVPPGLGRYAAQAFAANGREEDIQTLKLDPPAPPSEHEPVFGNSEIVLVGETGKAPMLDQTVFWGTWVRDGMLVVHWKGPDGEMTEALPAPGLPASELKKASKGKPTRSGTTFHIKFAMPSYKAVPSQARHVVLAVDGQGSAQSETYADTEDLLKRYLDETHTRLLVRTVIRVVLRTIASEKTKSTLQTDNPLLNLALNIGTDVLADQLEQADARTWFLLPRHIELARLAVPPGTYNLQAAAKDAQGRVLSQKDFTDVTVKPRQKKFVFLPAWQ